MKISKDNMIITIDTEICANGEAVAKELADMLKLPCYGEEILDKASELSGIPSRLMHRYDGHEKLRCPCCGKIAFEEINGYVHWS